MRFDIHQSEQILGMVRIFNPLHLALGPEDTRDLIADLKQALDRV